MSYTYLQGQGEEYSAECFSAIPACVLSRLSLIAEKSCFNGNETESCRPSRSGMTCEPLTADRGAGKSISCAEGFRARISVLQEKVLELKENEAGYGQKCGESLAKYDRDTLSLKTRQCLLFEEVSESLLILPEWGCLRDGELWEVTPPADVRTASACGLSLMRPTASDGLRHVFKIHQLIRKNHQDGNLSEQAARVIQKKITPECCEILMNWPEGWTDLKPLEMGKIRQWLNSHGKR